MAQAPRRFALIAAAGGGIALRRQRYPSNTRCSPGCRYIARTIAALAGSLALDAVFVVLAPEDARFESAGAIASRVDRAALRRRDAGRLGGQRARARSPIASPPMTGCWCTTLSRPCVDAATLIAPRCARSVTIPSAVCSRCRSPIRSSAPKSECRRACRHAPRNVAGCGARRRRRCFATRCCGTRWKRRAGARSPTMRRRSRHLGVKPRLVQGQCREHQDHLSPRTWSWPRRCSRNGRASP